MSKSKSLAGSLVMFQEPTKKHLFTLMFLVLFSSSAFIPTASAWSNGGYSSDPTNPDYGTHDWIAQHAKNWLPAVERKWIDDNLNYFLYGTEYPDNSGASYGTTSGYGDTTKHHNYYDSSGSVTDASAANRAKAEYDKALTELKAGRNVTAAIYAGSMSHYIDDVAVFGHVMTGETHHSDYEDHVGTRTASYSYGVFESYLVFDGELGNISAYNASISLGRNTFNDGGGAYTANWMDTHYDWSNTAFKNRCGESLNLATNYVADVLHTLAIAAFGVTTTETKSTSQISCSASSSSPIINQSITISGFVIPAHSSVTATLTYTKPDGSNVSRAATTNSTGGYKDVFAPSQEGQWAVQAKWDEDSDHYGATSSSLSFSVSKISSSISCSVSSTSISIGSSITVSGSITPARSGVTVTLSYILPNATVFKRTVTSASDGKYSDTYTPSVLGSWSVKASWYGDASYAGATSSSVSFTVSKISTTISCSTSSSEITEGDSVTVSGSISPAVSGKTVTLTYKKPDGSTFTRTVSSGSDGSYSDSYKPDVVGSWSVSASWAGDSTYDGASSSSKSLNVKKKGCIIATATYGSELSPEVQFLRDFRDNTVLNTFAGSNFMTVFNGFYYSFSPSVASTISDNEVLRGVMKAVLYPLIGALHVSSVAFSIFSFSPELAVVVAGLVASALIALVYVTPWFLLLSFLKKFRPSTKIIRIAGLIWTCSMVTMIFAEVTTSSLLMMISTAAFVLTTMALTTHISH